MNIYPTIKRLKDVVLSVCALVLLSPVLVLIALAIKLESPGPVLFKQKRIGKGKSEFYILKFRTMRIDTPKDTPTHLLANPEIYITRIGRVLRKTSLDELPQLINIIKGEMSIVGPRPALWNQCDLLSERDKYGANGIFPGLTGWAQVNGRDELPIPVKAELDGYYVANMGLLLDARILVLTALKVVTQKGVVEGASPRA